jgi:hypothetical protein
LPKHHLPPPPVNAPAFAAPPPSATNTPRGDHDRSSRLGLWIVLATVIALLAALLGYVIISHSNTATANNVVLEPVGVVVPNPFTASVTHGTESAPPPPGNTQTTVAPGAGGGQVAGSAVGLYGGTLNSKTCDPGKLLTFLEANSAKGAAWAKVQGISVGNLPAYINSLTPVILRYDTRVTNHGYANGQATLLPAVLQAGTAVLVDRFGVPRAKCACGNPLTEPAPLTTATKYTGPRWTGFTPSTVVKVTVNVEVKVFVLIDTVTGQPFDRPAGTIGTDDTPATPTTTTPPATTPPATTPPTTTTTAPSSGGSTGTSAPILFQITSIAGVSNGPTAPSVVDLPQASHVTALSTYHWNDGQGDTPGTIGLTGSDGTVYGPFQATGTPGQGGVPNANWVVTTDLNLPAGQYTVVDSSPGTWAWADDTAGRGMVWVYGYTNAP